MKRSIAYLIFPFLAWGQMTITTTEKVETALRPDIMRGTITFEEDAPKSSLIQEHLNVLVATFKRSDPQNRMCRGGGYYLSPQYRYIDQKRQFLGYHGSLRFDCEVNNIDDYNRLNAAADAAMTDNVKKNQGILEWDVSASARKEAENALRLSLIRQARQQALRFSAETGETCTVTSVDYTSTAYPAPIYAARAMMTTGAMPETQSPLQHDETLTIEARVQYTCAPSH